MGVYRSNPALGFGSIVITMTTAPLTTFILEVWTPVSPIEMAERKNNLNQPNGFVQVDQARTATATAQLATASTLPPVPGQEFVVDTVTYVVGEVTAPKEYNGIWKCNFNAREKV